MNDDLIKIRARLRALREKTVANGCSEDEALAAAELVSKLLSKHGLSEDELSPDAPMFISKKIGKRSPLDAIWFTIAHFADCDAWLQRADKGLHIVYFGRERDVLIAEYVFDVMQGATSCAQREFRASPTYKARRTAKTRSHAVKAFQEGFQRSVVRKLFDGLWLRYGEVAGERYQFTRLALKDMSSKQGLHFSQARPLGKAQGAFRDEAQSDGRAAGRKVEVHAGLNTQGTEIAGLLR